MVFYFLNSYQLSPAGFQLSRLTGWDSLLEPIQPDDIFPTEVQGILNRSGAVFAMGCINGLDYLVLRNIIVTDDAERQWYINFAVTAGEEYAQFFRSMVRKILLDYSGLLSVLKECFYPINEASLSYGIHLQLLKEWAEGPQPPYQDFYQTRHIAIDKLGRLLNKISTGPDSRLLVLVPESTVRYFKKQNGFFSDDTPSFLFSSEIFYLLLHKDDALFEKTWSKQQSGTPLIQKNASEYFRESTENPSSITSEQMNKIISAGKIIAGLALLTVITHIIKKRKNNNPGR